MDSTRPDLPVPMDEIPVRTGISPSQALNRFQPPEGFVPVVAEAATRQLRYGFRTAGLSLLIRQGVGSEAVSMLPLATLPNGPTWLLGVINLRGNLVPVCDLRQVLGEGAEDVQQKPLILVLDKGEKAVGFLIDGYPCALTTLRPANQVPGLPEPLARHVPEALSTDEEIWLEFDHEGFLLGAERY